MANTSNNFLTQTLSQYHSDIVKLQTEVLALYTKIGALCAECKVKHRLNLTEEIARLDEKITTNESNIDSIDNYIKNLDSKLNELTGKLNILTLKYDNILKIINEFKDNKQKSNDKRINFIIQILIIVLSSIILGVLGVVSTYVWNGFINSFNDNLVNTESSKILPKKL